MTGTQGPQRLLYQPAPQIAEILEAERDKAERRPELGFLLHLPPVCPRSDPHKPVLPKEGMRKLRARLGALAGSSEVEAQQLCSQVPVKSAGRRLCSTESWVSRLCISQQVPGHC